MMSRPKCETHDSQTFLTRTTFVVFLGTLCVIHCNPIDVETIETFDDPWDYERIPHNYPMLTKTTPAHRIPEETLQNAKDSIRNKDDDDDDLVLGTSTSGVDEILSRLTCSSCRLGVTLLRSAVVKEDARYESIKEQFVGVCTSLNIAVQVVCAGIYDVYSPVALPILKMTDLSSENICALLLGELCGLVSNPTHEWLIDLPPEPEDARNFSHNGDYDIWSSPLPPANGPVFKVLHITDTHFDPEYQEGAIANCQEPLCCRNDSSPPMKDEIIRAGRYGSYAKCDSPKILIGSMLENIANEHKDIDYVIWSGDAAPHDIWRQTRERTLENVRDTINELVRAFPDVPIFPALGNHEGVPSGNFPPPWIASDRQSITWLYEAISTEWAKWLPPETNTTLLHGGFYSVLIRPGFRLISLNLNYCHSFSWWLVLNSTDPAKELKWLVYELENAERNNERVHIIGHIPPGAGDCLRVWSKNYYDIINRFRNTVVAQFFGHTHNDEFELFYDDEYTSRATAIAYIGPSVTTFENLNPGYRIYYVDGDRAMSTREVIDHETWIMDLDKANANPDVAPTWRKLYSAKAAYHMTSLRPADWSNILNHLIIDENLFDKFYKYFTKASPFRAPCKSNRCRFNVICALKSAKSNDKLHLCKEEEEYLLTQGEDKKTIE